MTGSTNVERILDAFLAPEADRLPDRVVDAALADIARTPQRRALYAPWTSLAMTPQARRGRFAPRRFLMIPKLLAATAVVVIVVAGGLALFGGRPASVGASPSPAVPSPTVAPSPTAGLTFVDRSASGYTVTIPSSWHSGAVANWPSVLYLSAAAPITGVYVFVGDASGSPATYTIHEFGAAAGMDFSGSTAAQLLQSFDAFSLSHWSARGTNEHPVTVDGASGLITEHTWSNPDQIAIDLFVIHGTRAYDLEMNAPIANVADARTAFDALVSSIRWSSTP